MNKHKLRKLIDRFLSHVGPEDANGCTVWIAKSQRQGYGIFRMPEGTTGAHRASYRLFVGKIPEGKQVCHTCDVKLCVKPEHLFVGSHLDNMIDRVKKGRAKNGDHFRKLDWQKVKAIRADKRPQQIIADEYGVCRTSISKIKNNRAWIRIEFTIAKRVQSLGKRMEIK